MSGFICPHCGKKSDIFDAGGGEVMANEMQVPFLGYIPMDTQIVQSCDSGKPFVSQYKQSQTAKAFEKIISPVLEIEKSNKELTQTQSLQTGGNKMRIAIPLTGGKLSQHFGHCEQFAIIDADKDNKTVKSQELVNPPAHQPGVLPKWLAGLQVELIIAGGMGQRAQQLFTQNQINVVVGASENSPEELVSAYLEGRLECGENICDH
jgi:predicted Fe-Mo cluster-binding NifX family protein